ncbi:hypothetical protein GW746_00605 [Candidatus Saccharibacteria bacterium]|nr:hypothetical protein [Candidatus Saccharibacteria bacterium]NCS82906.1 hypothetical protein [Candidatus Saccharibacteria bacterium]
MIDPGMLYLSFLVVMMMVFLVVAAVSIWKHKLSLAIADFGMSLTAVGVWLVLLHYHEWTNHLLNAPDGPEHWAMLVSTNTMVAPFLAAAAAFVIATILELVARRRAVIREQREKASSPQK